jgi:hypothetical protein
MACNERAHPVDGTNPGPTRKRRIHTMRVVKPDGPVQPGNRRDLTHLMHETANNHKQGLEAYTRASSTW